MYTSPFELVGSDLWGATHINSGGYFYYISFVDVYSRYTWLYLLKNKGEALRCFVQFQKYVEVQFGCHIMMFQSDWGGEFRSFTKVLSQSVIQHRITFPHTSKQNGVVEGKHRHIVEIGLTLLAQASLPMGLWSHAFVHVVHLINRLPTVVLQGHSPYEKLFKVRLDYSRLKVFGCFCFPYLGLYNQHKLQLSQNNALFLVTTYIKRDLSALIILVEFLYLGMLCLIRIAFLYYHHSIRFLFAFVYN